MHACMQDWQQVTVGRNARMRKCVCMACEVCESLYMYFCTLKRCLCVMGWEVGVRACGAMVLFAIRFL